MTHLFLRTMATVLAMVFLLVGGAAAQLPAPHGAAAAPCACVDVAPSRADY